ncbi:MAG TPA: hypothetical protein VK826_09745 [Bacteroidia bacterium]|nr:hypothetical protein [Bacteroidia bacterium]
MKKSVLLITAVWIVGLALTAQTLIQRVFPSYDQSWGVGMAWSPADETYAMVTMNSIDQLNVSKTDLAGVLLWQKVYIIPGVTDCVEADVDVASNGTMYVCGTFYDETYHRRSHYVVCLDRDGVVLWTKTYRTTSTIGYGCPKVKVLDNGDLLITESVFGHIGYLRTDAMGNLLRSHMYREDSTAENKSPGFDSDVFPDGSYIFTGKRRDDIMVIRTDSAGQMMWHRCWNSGSEYYHTKTVIALDDGTSIVGGGGDDVPFLMRISSTGDKLWYYSYHSGAGDFYDIEQLDPGTFIAVGNMSGRSVMVKFDINGNVLETRDVFHALHSFRTTNVEIGPAGTIAWPLSYWNNGMNSFGSILMISRNAGSTGCMFETSSITQGLVANPDTVQVPIYMLAQSIVVASVTTVVGDVPPNQSDVCPYFDLSPFTNEYNDLVIASTVIGTMDPVKFSMTNYAGDVTYSLSDMRGRIIFSGRKEYHPGDQVVINTGDDLACGMYTLNVEAGKEYFSEKFLVQ